MLPVTPLPATGEVFLDARGADRVLRLSWHREAGVVVLSLWHGNVCTGSFRLPIEQLPELVAALQERPAATTR